MKIKSQKDFWSGLVFVAIGVAFAWGATTYPLGDAASPGPGYFPFGLGLILALLGGFVLFTSLTVERPGGDRVEGLRLRPALSVALPVLVLLTCLSGDEFSWRDALVSAVVLTVGAWVVFDLMLKLTLPVWPALPARG